MSFHFLVRFQNGFVFHKDLETDRLDNFKINEIIMDAMFKSGQRCKRSEPVSLTAEIFKLSVKDGRLCEYLYATRNAQLPWLPLTEDEYKKEMDSIVFKIPEEFHAFVRDYSYAQGHDEGYDNCLSIASELVSELKTPLAAYTKRIS